MFRLLTSTISKLYKQTKHYNCCKVVTIMIKFNWPSVPICHLTQKQSFPISFVNSIFTPHSPPSSLLLGTLASLSFILTLVKSSSQSLIGPISQSSHLNPYCTLHTLSKLCIALRGRCNYQICLMPHYPQYISVCYHVVQKRGHCAHCINPVYQAH